MSAKTIVIDLDHTICTPANGEDQSEDQNLKYSCALPDMELIERVRDYQQSGYRITIHTSRNMRTYGGNVDDIRRHTLPIIIEWLHKHDVPYDEIVIGKPWCGFEGFYVDDRAVRPSEFRDLSERQIADLLDRERSA